ncbi:MAG: hypothetical protein CME64_16970 [Halobacteriovoraceae bacterium]|nr:hypothetical protein [Halobacteriovoraceae bacterium]|tara:strand:+ start:220876 stop:221214 length:339 start_codon:yes stop_codon:yes gene_type:complete
MKIMTGLKGEKKRWQDELKHFKVESIFLNNLCSQAFKKEVDSFIEDLEKQEDALDEYEMFLDRNFDSFSALDFELFLESHGNNAKKMRELNERFNKFKLICKKMAFKNLAVY